MLVGSEFPKQGWVVGDFTPFFIGYISKVVWWYSHFCGRFLFRFSWLHVHGLHPYPNHSWLQDHIFVMGDPSFWMDVGTTARCSFLTGWLIHTKVVSTLFLLGSSVFDRCFLFFVGSTSWWFYSLLWCLNPMCIVVHLPVRSVRSTFFSWVQYLFCCVKLILSLQCSISFPRPC